MVIERPIQAGPDLSSVVSVMSGFGKQWEGGDKQPLGKSIRETINPPGALKPRMEFAAKRVKSQVQRLEQESTRMGERDKTLFNKVVDAYQKHDTPHANIYANELAELRRMERVTLNAKLALDQITMRIEAVSELGDLAYTLLPVIGVMREVMKGMASVNPQIAKEMGDISNILSGIVMDAGATSGMSINFESANEDARLIAEEAAMVAEKRMKDTFPELPGGSKVPL
jgi:division protein CdvB (Snf7/Vps24/ESCRT-III family)